MRSLTVVAVMAVVSALLVPVAARATVVEATPSALNIGQRAFQELSDVKAHKPMPGYEISPHSMRGHPLDWCTRQQDGQQVLTCAEWAVQVEQAGAWRLRVAVDALNAPATIGQLDIELYDPANVRVATRRMLLPLNAEVVAARPVTGTWVVRVVPVLLSEELEGPLVTGVLARAKLEAEPTQERESTLLPNLRAETPHALRLGCEMSDTSPPAPAWRCLRFPFGYQNVGAGPLELQIEQGAAGPATPYEVTQVVYAGPDTTPEYTDNTVDHTRPAGTATYHQAHGHFHYDNILFAQLFRADAEGGLTQDAPVDAAKRGTCAHDGLLASFKRFRDIQGQADSGDACRGLGDAPGSLRIGLSPGWADLYAASLADNYVPFPPDAGGHWVLQIRIDHVPGSSAGLIEETDETDNVGYVWFSFDNATGTATVLERGHGTHPQDPRKTIVHDYGE